MSEPQMQSPLHSLGLAAEARAIDGSAGVWANEIPLQGYISLRGQSGDAAFVAAASEALGLGLPTVPCTLAVNGATRALWISPDEWIIVTPRPEKARLLKALSDSLKSVRSQVVDNSGGYTEVVLKGTHARDVLTHSTVYDIAHLGEGRVVGTTFGKSSVYLHCSGDGYRLILRRSFADYIWRFLARAAGPYGFGIARLEPGGA